MKNHTFHVIFHPKQVQQEEEEIFQEEEVFQEEGRQGQGRQEGQHVFTFPLNEISAFFDVFVSKFQVSYQNYENHVGIIFVKQQSP